MALERTEREIASDFAKLLTDREKYGRYGSSELEQLIVPKIKAIADAIAQEVVDAVPELRTILREKMQAAVTATLSKDAELNDIVLRAVSSALAQTAQARAMDGGN